MSNATECGCSPCNPAVVSTPGSAGESAWATTTAIVTIPAANASIDIPLTNVGWIVAGEVLILDGPYTFEVNTVDPNTLTINAEWLDYDGDKPTGSVVAAGNKMVPSGKQGAPVADPLPVANGGTGGATVAAAKSNLFSGVPLEVLYGGTGAAAKGSAQTNLGLGQDPLISTVSGLSQAVTASAVQVAGSDVTIPAAGNWLVSGNMRITMAAATFAASQTVTAKIRNTTQGVDVVSTTVKTCINATTGDVEIVIPPVNYSGGSVNDHLQIFVSVSVIATGGTFNVASATLCAVPLRKS